MFAKERLSSSSSAARPGVTNGLAHFSWPVFLTCYDGEVKRLTAAPLAISWGSVNGTLSRLSPCGRLFVYFSFIHPPHPFRSWFLVSFLLKFSDNGNLSCCLDVITCFVSSLSSLRPSFLVSCLLLLSLSIFLIPSRVRGTQAFPGGGAALTRLYLLWSKNEAVRDDDLRKPKKKKERRNECQQLMAKTRAGISIAQKSKRKFQQLQTVSLERRKKKVHRNVTSAQPTVTGESCDRQMSCFEYSEAYCRCSFVILLFTYWMDRAPRYILHGQ